MTQRVQIVLLSVVACVFGGLSLWGPEDDRSAFYAVNVVLSVAASIWASIDLRRRGLRWGWAMVAAYLLPLVGTVLYVAFSSERPYVEGAPVPS